MLYQTKSPHGGDIYGGRVLLDFSANTNPLGTPQSVLDAVCRELGNIHRYPDPYCRALVQAISAHEGVPEENILCGNGAAELIYSYCFAVRPQRALEFAPTFSEYSLAAQRVGCSVQHFPLLEENEFVPDESLLSCLIDNQPDVLFLCNPNNPTGRLVPPPLMESILSVCAKDGIRVFLDECFLDLTEEGLSLTGRLGEYPELFILKAFTKSYGMAGIRLGYGMSADKELLAKMSETVPPWNVSSLAQTAGIAALQEKEFLEKTRALIRAERDWLQRELTALGFQAVPSSANYILFKAAPWLEIKLQRKAILIRDCSNYNGLGPGWYRIAVRRRDENEQLIAAIREIIKDS